MRDFRRRWGSYEVGRVLRWVRVLGGREGLVWYMLLRLGKV